MRKTMLLAFLLASSLSRADLVAAKATILIQPGATPAELHAARELRDHLSQITGVTIPLKEDAKGVWPGSIVIGQGPLARKLFPSLRWEALGDEQTLIKSKGDVLLVAGGRPRGTLYAVYRLLGRKCGVRWWAPWASKIPKKPQLAFGKIDWSESPAFEYRDTFWFHAFDGDWAARNFSNGFSARVDEAHGGKTVYQGFVHTYYGLIPPEKHFKDHPEWFSLINGKRTTEYAQLCTTNPALRDEVVRALKEQLRANPKATIASVSQNDWYNPCQCAPCRELAAKEGSDAALVLDLANYVGEKIEKEFPKVAVDTLAYQWSRHPTKTMRPRHNVIVRLCNIECNFAHTLESPTNASFGDDIRGWSKLTNRLYVWNYCTNFAHYVAPHPSYFTIGPDIQFFAKNGVKGVFEQGAYQSNGGDMAELKAWVTAQMLWDPKQYPNKLVDEFLVGYYGKAAAPFMRQYLRLLASEAKGWNLTFASAVTASFLRYEVVDNARRWLMQAAYGLAPDDPRFWRVSQAMANLDYVWLSRWREFRAKSVRAKGTWLVPKQRADLAARWLRTLSSGPTPWKAVSHVNEGGLTPQQFVERLGPEPGEPTVWNFPKRPESVPPPPGVEPGLDLQDDLATLWREPDGAELRPDPLASDGIACWMPGSHLEWAFQIPLSKVKVFQKGSYKVYVVARVDSAERDDSAGFQCGVYDPANRKNVNAHVFPLSKLAPGYAAYELGTFSLEPQMYLWAAPPASPKVKAVWIDRWHLVKA